MNNRVSKQLTDARFLRGMILRMLYACRPGLVSEKIVLQVLQTFGENCQLEDVRHAISQMCSLGLAENSWDGLMGWRARVAPLGIAIVEYKAPVPRGISRPRKSRSPRS